MSKTLIVTGVLIVGALGGRQCGLAGSRKLARANRYAGCWGDAS
jgi:hypothetical protein